MQRRRRPAACLGGAAVAYGAAVLGGFAGCAVDVRDGVGPRVPIPNVTGHAMREANAADGLDVELRTLGGGAVVAATSTDAGGRFSFADVTAGDWEIKVSGDEPGDFDSVSQEFQLVDPEETLDLLPLDISAYGAAVEEPPDGATLAPPTLFEPTTFSWKLPDTEVAWARVQLYDEDGDAVWSSAKEVTEQADWNGIGNEGSYVGIAVSAGTYSWRVKLELAAGLQARLDPRTLVLQ
jgi:hypothetical protein